MKLKFVFYRLIFFFVFYLFCLCNDTLTQWSPQVVDALADSKFDHHMKQSYWGPLSAKRLFCTRSTRSTLLWVLNAWSLNIKQFWIGTPNGIKYALKLYSNTFQVYTKSIFLYNNIKIYKNFVVYVIDSYLPQWDVGP